jgi:chemotaxis protein MotB
MSGGGHPKKGKRLIEMPHPPHAEEGEGSWLVSYADMMTLLVGFFVILMSFSKVDEEKFEQIKQAATKEFGGVYQVPYGDIADRIKAALTKLGLGDQFVIKQSPLGVEISFHGTVFFETGSAEMKEQGADLLEGLIPIIKSEAKDFNLTIEGHTDDVPLVGGGKFHSNWDLSSVRACRVLEIFEKSGFPKQFMTAVGYADARPIVPNRDAAGVAIPANQSQNRRVVIKLLKKSVSSLGVEAPAPTDHPTGSESVDLHAPPPPAPTHS